MATAKKATRKKKAAKGPVVPAINAQETWLCHLTLAGDEPEKVAEKMGLSIVDVMAWLGRAQVKRYMSVYREVFLHRMVESEVLRLLKKKVTREAAAEQLFGLSLMPPERTKGSIEGQVRALTVMAELMGWKLDPKDIAKQLAALTDKELENLETSGPTN